MRDITIKDTLFKADTTHIMGILNVTPDSFSDGGVYYDTDKAINHALEMVKEGADIIDIGAESTRPGAQPIGNEEEWQRLEGVVKGLRACYSGLISVDTTKASIAQKSLEAGADIINDISGLTQDLKMADVIASFNSYVVIMDNKDITSYAIEETNDIVIRHLKKRLDYAVSHQIDCSKIILDPGIGFGKTTEQNLYILNHLGDYQILDTPLLLGCSRKSCLRSLVGSDLNKLDQETAKCSLRAQKYSWNLVRVHNVKMNQEALKNDKK